MMSNPSGGSGIVEKREGEEMLLEEERWRQRVVFWTLLLVEEGFSFSHSTMDGGSLLLLFSMVEGEQGTQHIIGGWVDGWAVGGSAGISCLLSPSHALPHLSSSSSRYTKTRLLHGFARVGGHSPFLLAHESVVVGLFVGGRGRGGS